jgi:AraC-like DNA-binding protein
VPLNRRAETPISFIKAICQAYERQGKSPQRLLETTQITPSLLTCPAAKVSSLQMERASALAMQALDDEALGWFERRLPWGSYAMLLRASLTAPNLGVALRRWCRHHGLLTERIALEVQIDHEKAKLILTERQPLRQRNPTPQHQTEQDPEHDWQEFCVVSVLRNALGVAQWLIDSQIRLQSIALGFAAPPHQDSYQVLFEGPVTFDASEHALTFDAGYLALPIRRDEAAARRLLQRALQLMVWPYRRDRLLIERLRQLLKEDPAQQTAQSLAQAMHISTRTLHRQLLEQGTSLQAIKDKVRAQQACELLAQTDRPIKHIAAAVGFGNEKSFTRAFKGWHGISPGQWRQRLSAQIMTARG